MTTTILGSILAISVLLCCTLWWKLVDALDDVDHWKHLFRLEQKYSAYLSHEFNRLEGKETSFDKTTLDLIRLATHQNTTVEEARSAAMQAVKRIHKQLKGK